METNNFEAAVAENNAAQAHAIEIQQTRIGGLGGSDAAIVYKIGERGLAALTATDMKRLAIMTGKQEPDNWGGNAYTNAGHAFEDWAEKTLPRGARFEREKFMTQPLARNFKTFAHADFVENDAHVIECKFVQDTIENTARKYWAQLQWYYLLGATTVTLYHGTGTAEPFEAATGELMRIQRDEVAIEILLNGIRILDDALTDGWQPTPQDKIAYLDTPEIVKRAFDKLLEIKQREAELKTQKDEAVNVLKTYLEDWTLTGIVAAGETRHTVTYNRASVAMTFDADKFLKEHPEFDKPQYYKQSKRAASVTFK